MVCWSLIVLLHIDHGCSGQVPGYGMKVASNYTLRIYKTEKAWCFAVESWEDDRNAVQKEVDKAFDDEGKRKSMKERLDRKGDCVRR